MAISRRTTFGLGAALALGGTARAQGETLRIGLLSDMSGPYSDISGPNAAVLARQAIQDFGATNRNLNVELTLADHQNRADVGVNIARQWYDQGIDAIMEVNNSAIALAINNLAREKNKVHLNTGGASVDLTGRGCSPNMVHWTTDTWANVHSTGGALARQGAKRWYCITADYAFGHALQQEVTRVVQANGGQMVGSSVYPFPQTTDYSSFLVTAAAQRPDVIALCNAGTDMINCVKQGQEFGLAQRNIRVAAMIGFIVDIHTLGLQSAGGLIWTESTYWDLNDRVRGLTQRVRGKMGKNHMPNSVQFQAYAGLFHYLKAAAALGVARTKASGLEAVEQMKRMPTDDDALGQGSIRQDGRVLFPVYLFQAKAPRESTGPWDYMKLLATTPADQSFRPMAEGGCSFIRS